MSEGSSDLAPFLAGKGGIYLRSEGHPQTPARGAPPLCTPLRLAQNRLSDSRQKGLSHSARPNFHPAATSASSINAESVAAAIERVNDREEAVGD